MTYKEKQLLLKGLHRNEVQRLLIIDSFGSYQVNGYDAWFNLSSVEFKPYLRPMSSMTEEEQRTLNSMCNGVEMVSRLSGLKMFDKAFDWLNEHHFDYRGLIPMGLALEAKEEMYK